MNQRQFIWSLHDVKPFRRYGGGVEFTIKLYEIIDNKVKFIDQRATNTIAVLDKEKMVRNMAKVWCDDDNFLIERV